jgi:hypothetical protein
MSSLPALIGLTVSVQGTNTGNGVSYTVGKVSNTTSIASAKFTELATKVNSERARRNLAAFTYTLDNPISAASLNTIKNALAVSGVSGGSAYMGAFVGYNSTDGRYQTGTEPSYDAYGNYLGDVPIYADLPAPGIVTYPAAAAPSVTGDVAATSLIYASTINSIIDSILAAGLVCTCNCNYCTCNCNYCTCNCNYACTCNCNYSDERVKTEIEYM